jgi:NAD(P)-dependent dehydrogenase (short-subunit alcohol dehydrogenase family)
MAHRPGWARGERTQASREGGRKVWLITGSSRGFGTELVTAVLENGDAVLATARHPEDIKQPSDEHRERFRTAPLDVTDPGAAEAAVTLAQSDLGGLDVVVNNAGYANSASIEEMDPEDFRAQVEANLFGVINVTRAAPLYSELRGRARSSSSLPIGGRVGGTPGMGAYQTAKFAVEGFSEVLANEVKPFGIDVVIVEPGAFRTDWQGSSSSGEHEYVVVAVVGDVLYKSRKVVVSDTGERMLLSVGMEPCREDPAC